MFSRNADPAALRAFAIAVAAAKIPGLAFTLEAGGAVKVRAGTLPPDLLQLAAKIHRASPAPKLTPPQPSPAEPVRAAFDLASILPPKP